MSTIVSELSTSYRCLSRGGNEGGNHSLSEILIEGHVSIPSQSNGQCDTVI